MKVEIWSDVMCPFCYIGKRKFETALKDFPHKDEVEIIWRSFQLNPEMQTEPGKKIHQYLAENKGIPEAQAKQMLQQVTAMAAGEGLTYHMDDTVVANSLRAHQLIQLAKTKGLGDAAEEALFKAHFTDTQNIDDTEVLVNLALSIGIAEPEIRNALESDEFAEAVQADIYKAQQVGVRGVPFFVFNEKYAVSGAQPSEVFAGALSKTWEEIQPQTLAGAAGNSCDIDGKCN